MAIGIELAEELEDLFGFEVDAFDLVIFATTFDGGPFDDAGGRGAAWVAHVTLLINFLRTGSSLAVGNELQGSKGGAFGAVDDGNQTEFDGIGHGNAEVEVPKATGKEGWIFDF